MRDRERGKDRGRGRSRLPAGTPRQDSIPGLHDHDGPKAGAQPLSHPGIPSSPTSSSDSPPPCAGSQGRCNGIPRIYPMGPHLLVLAVPPASKGPQGQAVVIPTFPGQKQQLREAAELASGPTASMPQSQSRIQILPHRP